MTAPERERLWNQTWTSNDFCDMLHITPLDDAVEHELDWDCLCGPYRCQLEGADFLVAHHPLM